MGRLHLLEIHDQPWCPRWLRDAMTDYLEKVEHLANTYGPIRRRLSEALRRLGAKRVVDLCSGGGGPWARLAREFGEEDAFPVEVTLTDWRPNESALAERELFGDRRIRLHPEPVDARRVPASLAGFRTLFSSFHHFRPDEARAILRDAVESGEGIGVFEATQRNAIAIAAMLFIPVPVWLVTPFIRPFRWTRVVFTYLLPLIPLAVMIDGVVSCLRTYSPDELRELVREADRDASYAWEIGTERIRGLPAGVTYLIGSPPTTAA